jgi:hypothetical protein
MYEYKHVICEVTMTDAMKKIWTKCGQHQMFYRPEYSETTYLALKSILYLELFMNEIGWYCNFGFLC